MIKFYKNTLALSLYKTKLLLKSLLKDKKYFILNLTGLTVYFITTYLILSYLFYENNFDRFNDRYDNIYRIISVDKKSGAKDANASFVLTDLIRSNFNRDIQTARVKQLFSVKIKIKNEYFPFNEFFCSDPELLNILTFKGLPANNFNPISGSSVIISESFAKLHNIHLHEIINIQFQSTSKSFLVNGIFEDFPSNSSMRPNCIAPLNFAVNYVYGSTPDSVKPKLSENYFTTFIYLPPAINRIRFSAVLNKFIGSINNNADYHYYPSAYEGYSFQLRWSFCKYFKGRGLSKLFAARFS